MKASPCGVRKFICAFVRRFISAITTHVAIAPINWLTKAQINLRTPHGLFLLLLPAAATAQVPDVRARADLSLSLDYRNNSDRTNMRLYSPLGRPSVVALSLTLETGYNVLISERLQRLPGDADGDIFDETYIEDPGIWRVGKQYLPFGGGRLIHESATAARIDTNLIAESMPVALALCSTGKGRQNGLIMRVGRALGVSIAAGEHFGISGTSLGVIRRPDLAPGKGGGWKRAFSVDGARRYGKVSLSGEAAAFAGGPAPDQTVVDLEMNYLADNYHSLGVGYSYAAHGALEYTRLFGRVHAARNIDLEPLVRWRDGGFYDASVTLRVKL
jgi:hypothetical protein